MMVFVTRVKRSYVGLLWNNFVPDKYQLLGICSTVILASTEECYSDCQDLYEELERQNLSYYK